MRPRKEKPASSAAGAAAEAERQARLAAALRENLRKRKLQRRSRAEVARDHGPNQETERQSIEGKPPVK
jgi:hypothetical protein